MACAAAVVVAVAVVVVAHHYPPTLATFQGTQKDENGKVKNPKYSDHFPLFLGDGLKHSPASSIHWKIILNQAIPSTVEAA